MERLIIKKKIIGAPQSVFILPHDIRVEMVCFPYIFSLPGNPSFFLFLFLFLSSLWQVTLDEFTTAILAREQFSKMLTLKIIDIFVEEE